MPEDKKIFSEEYVQDSKTSVEDEQKIQESGDLKVDCEKYGISKPTRIIIRGSVIHVKS